MSDPDLLIRRWHVLHVHPRCEKKIADTARTLGLSHYLPLRSATKIYQRRKVTVGKPVFPGYCFVSFDWEGRLELLKTNQIARFLVPPSQRQLLHQLAQIRRALRVDPTLAIEQSLDAGTRVRIATGPFMGVEGLVAEIKGISKVLLNVEMIGQAVALEVRRDFLEILD
ncbi:MAG: hypothetical protein A2498_02650 [Lentisphaerae bacterium RIFOXYC12_FULL_60_16]|nr:MAG: hypothetical protein A2498_02650 [Lentisphaerae bacterium RIFOXYC12_FULL_60_16]OGV77679.1 MAG: hypothetical protein A2340_11935 [Lentisphaerae bacterium RIFOXYB12_FULL_60_10]